MGYSMRDRSRPSVGNVRLGKDPEDCVYDGSGWTRLK